MALDFGELFRSSFIIIKAGTLILLFVYIIFTIVILTQVRVMDRLVKEKLSSEALKIMAIIHVVLALSLFLTALVIL